MQNNKPLANKKFITQLVFISGLLILLVGLKSNFPDGLEKVAADNNFSDKEKARQCSMVTLPCSEWWTLFSGVILCLIIGYFIGFAMKQYGKRHKRK